MRGDEIAAEQGVPLGFVIFLILAFTDPDFPPDVDVDLSIALPELSDSAPPGVGRSVGLIAGVREGPDGTLMSAGETRIDTTSGWART